MKNANQTWFGHLSTTIAVKRFQKMMTDCRSKRMRTMPKGKKNEAEHGKDEKTESPTITFLKSIRGWNRPEGTSRKTDKMKTLPECLEDF